MQVGRGRARAVAAGVCLALLVTACSSDGGGGGGDQAGADGGEGAGGNGSQQTTTAAPPPPRQFTLAASGDILLHAPVIRDGQANAGGEGYDFNPMFDDVRELISAPGFAICHQETPISADNTDLTQSGTLSFNAPRQIAVALKNAGFDACDTASNHTWDRGLEGIQETLAVLEEAGLRHSGASRSQEEADTPPIYDIAGVPVGHLAYTYTIFNTAEPDLQFPDEAPWLRSMLWPAIGSTGILDHARRLKERGAEFVVVSMHWGAQYQTEPTERQRQLARELLASPDIDLIIGDHVHVVQPCERIGEEYVHYGMGNFLSNQSPTQDDSLEPETQDGTLVTYTVDEVPEQRGEFRVTQMVYAPTFVEIPDRRIVRATPDRHPESYLRTAEAMGALGPGACDAVPAY